MNKFPKKSFEMLPRNVSVSQEKIVSKCMHIMSAYEIKERNV